MAFRPDTLDYTHSFYTVLTRTGGIAEGWRQNVAKLWGITGNLMLHIGEIHAYTEFTGDHKCP